jgi:hypothetical protein
MNHVIVITGSKGATPCHLVNRRGTDQKTNSPTTESMTYPVLPFTDMLL